MKRLAYLIITLSLIAGALSGATAYLAPIDNPDRHDELDAANLTFKSDAGSYDPTPHPGDEDARQLADTIAAYHAKLDQQHQQTQRDAPTFIQPIDIDLPQPPDVNTAPPATERVRNAERAAPIARAGDPVTAQYLQLLADNGVPHIRVKQFAPLRWPHNWVFVLAVLGLTTGAAIIKTNARAARKTSPTQEATPKSNAHAAIDSIAAALLGLAEELPKLPDDDARLARIIETLGKAQRNDVPAFAADRPKLVAALGLAGFAELMDRFATLERQINRAWSAAADRDLQESLDCIEAATLRLEPVQHKLPDA